MREPTKTKKRLALRHAASELRQSRERQGRIVRTILDSRTERCAPRCKGWFIDPDKDRPVRCDECASLNGYADALSDDDVEALPAALRAWKGWLATHGDPDMVSQESRERRVVDWLVGNVARTTDVSELRANDAVRACAACLNVTPEWLAGAVSVRLGAALAARGAAR